jgi:hypothetical protein
MSKRERVEAAMNLQETDRTPVFDLLYNDDCIRYFTGEEAVVGEEGIKTKCKATAKMLDMTRGAQCGPMKEGYITDEDGFVHSYERWCYLGIHKRPFEDEDGATEWLKKSIETLRYKSKNDNYDAIAGYLKEDFIKIQNYIGDDTVVLLNQSGTGLDDIRHKLGLEIFSYLAIDEPELISEYINIHTEREIKIIHSYADKKLSPCALTYGDIAMKNTLMHSPEWLRKEFFPNIRKLNSAYHEHDIKCLFHSDGNLMEIMDDLIDTGIDGLNPIETLAGMKVETVFNLYGDKIFITGGIDMSQLLANGTPEEVTKVCEDAIRSAPRGYFIGSTTEIDNSARLENVLAMLRVAGVMK